jgi:hypothetical protein
VSTLTVDQARSLVFAASTPNKYGALANREAFDAALAVYVDAVRTAERDALGAAGIPHDWQTCAWSGSTRPFAIGDLVRLGYGKEGVIARNHHADDGLIDRDGDLYVKPLDGTGGAYYTPEELTRI